MKKLKHIYIDKFDGSISYPFELSNENSERGKIVKYYYFSVKSNVFSIIEDWYDDSKWPNNEISSNDNLKRKLISSIFTAIEVNTGDD